MRFLQKYGRAGIKQVNHGFVALLVLMAAASAVFFVSLSSIVNETIPYATWQDNISGRCSKIESNLAGIRENGHEYNPAPLKDIRAAFSRIDAHTAEMLMLSGGNRRVENSLLSISRQVRSTLRSLPGPEESGTWHLTGDDIAGISAATESIDASVKEIYASIAQASSRHAAYVMKTVTKSMVIFVLVLSAKFLLALAIFHFVVYRVSRPIRNIVEGTRIVAAGNLNHRIAMNSCDELGELAQSFNSMTGKLFSAQEKIAEHNRDLKDQVAKATAALRRLSVTDDLTSVYNYRHFRKALELELERSTRHNHPVSMFMLDLDNFKNFNDCWGHQIGNEALRKISRLIVSSVRSIDIVARYGGEEFVVVLPMTGDYAVEVAERIRKSIFMANQVWKSGSQTTRLTVSIGVATFPCDAENSAGLIHAADEAMYRAKQQGKNKTCVYSAAETAGNPAGTQGVTSG